MKEGGTITYADIIAHRIYQICRHKHISLNRLAVLSGLRQSTLENIVKGNTKNPTLRTLHRIASGMNVTVAELLDFDAMNESVIED